MRVDPYYIIGRILLIGITSLISMCATLTVPHRLVGYGCVGASGPLYADEEDHFPLCEAIEINGPNKVLQEDLI
jgi:hypothetical protein